MSEEEPSTTPLWRLSEHHQDPLLFPLEVHEPYEAGERLTARERLASLTRKEKDEKRRARQQEALDDPYLWLQPVPGPPPLGTINGIGLMLYGRHKPTPSGHYVATHWATLVFVPILPLGAYVVSDAEGGGWYFFGRAPLPPGARNYRLGLAGLAAAAMLAFVGNAVWASRHVDVVAYNGHDRPLVVHVGDDVHTIGAHAAWTFEGVPAGPTAFAALVDGRTIDAFEADLAGRSRETVVYDVNGRGALTLDWVRYGDGDPPDGRLLPPDRLQFLPAVDHVFTEAPYSKELMAGAYVDVSVLGGADDVAPFADIVHAFYREHGVDAAIEVLLADLEVRPDNPEAVDVAWQLFMYDDIKERLAQAWRERQPESVHAHRLWQEAHLGEEGVREAYHALLEQHPDSPMHLYLYSRLLQEGAPEAAALLERAIAIDPAYALAWTSLGFQLACAGRLPEAADAYARYAELDEAGAQQVLTERLRVARLLGQPTDPLLDDFEAKTEAPWVRTMKLHLDVWDHPERLDADLAALPVDVTDLPPDAAVLQRAAAELGLCVAAGDADCAKTRIEALVGTSGDGAAAMAAIWLSAGRDGVARPLPPHDHLHDADPRLPLVAAYMVAYGLPGSSGWRERAETARHEAVRGLLDPAFDTNDVEKVHAALATTYPRERAVGYAVAALRARGPAAAELRKEARRYALPGEIPAW